jgi:hypothetical protein
MKNKHIVEVHIGKDVLSRDYDSEDCARRAMARLHSANITVRYWANGKLIEELQA